MAAPKAARTFRRADKSSAARAHNFMERLPSEILIRILSYLDASALYSLGHVNKLFRQLANDNALWYRIYMARFRKNEKGKPENGPCMDELLLKMALMEVKDCAPGYWKSLFFRTLGARDMDKWKRHRGAVSRHTGLPSRTEQVLRNMRVSWELTVGDKSGRGATYEPSRPLFCGASVTLCWGAGGGPLPDVQHISSLQLHGVRRIALNCPGLKKPGWRSLMAQLDMQTLTKSPQVIGQDGLVQLKLLQPGIVVGVWRGQSSVAFIMFTLHFHRLVERSVRGSAICPYVEPAVKPPFDDIDPEYGLHGYQLHIVLHNTKSEIMSGSYSQLFCWRTQIDAGLIQLIAISRSDLSQHTPLSGSVTLPWRCEALQGSVENCCIINLTLLDEFKKPFWCVSSPVSMERQQEKQTPVTYDYDGEHFLIHYRDSDGHIKMTLVWMEDKKQFVLVSLVVYVTVCKVNRHFGRNY